MVYNEFVGCVLCTSWRTECTYTTGKPSDSYDKAVAVWCAKDRNKALTAAKKDEKLEKKACNNPVDKHMQMAAEFEVKDTPFIISKKATLTQAMSLQRNWQKLYVLNKLIDKDF